MAMGVGSGANQFQLWHELWLSFMPFILKCGGTDGSIILYTCHRKFGMASSDTAGTKIHYVLYSLLLLGMYTYLFRSLGL